MSHTDSITQVEYRPIEDFPGYRIGNDGSAWSRWLNLSEPGVKGAHTIFTDVWHRLKPGISRKHLHVTLHREGKHYSRNIHRLVLEAFVGKRPKGMECRHLDDDPLNNNLSNLCWGTRQENVNDAMRNNRLVKGENYPKAKLTDHSVREIRAMYVPRLISQRELARKYGVTQSVIQLILTYKAWKHVD